jgi:3-oxoacyl-[acyl-carrier-protein] synthase-1
MSREEVLVTGIGMLTAVGNDAVQTAAAVRASIARLAGWEPGGMSDGEPRVSAGRVPRDYGDRPWLEKFEDILRQPMHEALWDAGLYDLVALRERSRGQLGLYLATPRADRAGVTASAYQEFVAEAKDISSVHARIDHLDFTAYDHAAGIGALQLAVDHLSAEKVDIAIVASVDSLLHTPYLARLAVDGFLKLPQYPHGLLPGEAAAVLVLERARDAAARKASARARVGALALDLEKIPLGENHPIRGEGASRAVAAALDADGRAGEIHRVITDMSGERWRAIEWAIVETRCLGVLAPGWQLWHPADCFGDVGAASSIAHAALSARAFARGYAGAGGVLLFAAAHGGQRAAATLWPPGGPSCRRASTSTR